MSLENYKNSTFVKAVLGIGSYQFDFTQMKAVQSVNLVQNISTSSETGIATVEGTITVVDYYEDLFTLLSVVASSKKDSNLESLVNNANRTAVSTGNTPYGIAAEGNFGTMAIGIKCYSGTRVWFLNVKGWSYNMGTPSTITFQLDMNSSGNMGNTYQSLQDFHMLDFGSSVEGSNMTYDKHKQAIQDAINSLQATEGSTGGTESTSSLSSIPDQSSPNMCRGVVGERYSEPEEVFKAFKTLYKVDVRFASYLKGTDKFFTLDEWISELKKEKKKLYFRNGMYEFAVMNSSVNANSASSMYEREFSNIIENLFAAKEGLKSVSDITNLPESEREIYTPRKNVDNSGSYLVAVRQDDESLAPADMEGTDLSLDRVVFLYNAPKPYGLWNNKVAIPLDSVSSSVDSSFLMNVNFDVQDTPNGTMVFTPSGRFMANDNATSTYMRLAMIALRNNKEGANVQISCRNFIHWGDGLSQYAEIYSYTSNGLAGVVQGFYRVTSVTFQWSGGVISTSVQLENMPTALEQNAMNAVRGGGSTMAGVHDSSALQTQTGIIKSLLNSSGTGSSSSDGTVSEDYVSSEDRGEPDNDGGSMASSANFCSYLCSGYTNPVPVSVDRTPENMKNGKFNLAVDELISLVGTKRVLDVSSDWFKKHILEECNMALLGLLGGAGNWGFSNVPSGVTDCMTLCKDGRKRKGWDAPDEAHGKGLFDYKVGGLGIAHFDSGALYNLYRLIGFPAKYATREMLNLIFYTNANSAVWQDMGDGSGRKIPYLDNGGKCICNFDGMGTNASKRSGLASRFSASSPFPSKPWQDWAHEILYAQNSDGSYPYQRILFRYWVDHFWMEQRNKLKNATLNDIFCIARISNSTPAKADTCCKRDGTAVAPKAQYNAYCVEYANTRGKTDEEKENKRARYARQLGNGRRVGDLIGYFYAQKMIKTL